VCLMCAYVVCVLFVRCVNLVSTLRGCPIKFYLWTPKYKFCVIFMSQYFPFNTVFSFNVKIILSPEAIQK